MKFLIFLLAIYKIFTAEEIIPGSDIDESIFQAIEGLTITSEQAIRDILASTDMTYLAYYYVKSSPNSRIGADILSRVAEKLNFLAGILLIDCDDYQTDNQVICKKPEDAKDGFPKMILYVPPEYKYNPYTKQLNEHFTKFYEKNEVSETLIYNFITQNIPSRSIALTSENHETFMSNYALNKVILFTEKPKTPLMWRGLSTYFYDRVALAHVSKDQMALIKKYKISTFPSIIIHQVHEEGAPLDSPIVDIYIGKLDAVDIAKTFEKYSLEEKLYVSARKEKNPDDLKFKAFFKKLNRDDYSAYFKKFPGKKFVVYLSNSDDVPESIKKFNSNTSGFFQFVKFNCKDTFCKDTFKFKTLPQLVMFKYDPKEEIDTQIATAKVLSTGDYESIYREISELYLDGFKVGSMENFQRLVYEATVAKKTPLLYFYNDDQTPLGLYLLSSDPTYKKYIEFIVFENPPKEIVNQFKLKTLPQLVFIIANPEQPDS
jgi:hypothetical protein